MFGIGPTEIIVILVIALIVFGPERLPEMAGQIAKTIRDFRRMSEEVTSEFQRTISFNEREEQQATSGATTETIGAIATPDTSAPTTPLSAQVIPTETSATETESVVSTASAPQLESPATEGPSPVAPYATKADPLAGVSLLDQPAAPPANDYTYSAAPSEPVATGASRSESDAVTYTSMPVATLQAPESAPTTNGIADAWEMVATTEATREVTTTLEAEIEPTSERAVIDPSAEPTIREVIEAQVASEAFRERRRRATYRKSRQRA